MAKKSKSTSKKPKDTDLEKELAAKPKDSVLTAVFKKEFWKIACAVLVILLLISFYFGGFVSTSNTEKIVQDTVDYINQNLMQGGATVKLLSYEESNGVVRIKLLVSDVQRDVFVTMDGVLLSTQTYDTTQPVQRPDAQPQQPQPAEIPKSDKPVVELYVMSFCPFGNQAEDAMYPVYEILKNQVDIDIQYIVSVSAGQVNSLHGQPEIDQNVREICVRNEYGQDAFWKFMTYVNANCGSDGRCWQDALAEIDADVDTVQDCLMTQSLELMTAEADATQAAGATGSPTLMINGVKTSGIQRTPEGYKTSICSAFNEAPEECGTALAAQTAAAAGSC